MRGYQIWGTAIMIWASFHLCVEKAHASTRIPEAMMWALAQVESAGGKYVVGDNGRALGAFQMHRASWKEVSEYRAKKGLRTWPYSYALHAEVGKAYARDYLTIQHKRLAQVFGRPPTPSELYAAYNLGFEGFKRAGFDMRRTPSSTRRAASIIHQHVRPSSPSKKK